MALPDLKDIQKHYENMSDRKLEHLASQNAEGLRPEVFEIIQNEITKRNLNPNLMQAVLAQNKEYSTDELSMYADYLRDLPCPHCGTLEYQLNGTETYTVESFFFYSTIKTTTYIACPECLDKKNNRALWTCIILGWWDLPQGFLRTPISIHKNWEAKKGNWLYAHSETLLSFAKTHIDYIETYKADREKLIELIHLSDETIQSN